MKTASCPDCDAELFLNEGSVLNRESTPSPRIVISEKWCKGCGICIALCPLKVLSRSDKLSSQGVYQPLLVNGNKCNGCHICQYYCPDFAIYTVTE